MNSEPLRDPQMSLRMSMAKTELKESVVPVFAMKDGSLRFVASGVLLRIKDKYYLLTAGHVADSLEKVDSGPHLMYEDERGPGCYDFKRSLISIPRAEKGFPFGYDVAIYAMTKRTAASLGVERFLTQADLEFFHNVDGDPGYIITGYPGAEQILRHDEKKVYLRFETLFTYAAAARYYRSENHPVNGRTHVLFEFPDKVVGERSLAEGPNVDPRGMSGGGAFISWNLADFDSPVRKPKLLGINTRILERNGQQVVEILRVDAVFEVLTGKSNYIRKLGLRFASGPYGV